MLAWIFVLGILVGRGFMPNTGTAISDLKGQISRLTPRNGVVSDGKDGGTGIPGKVSAPDPKLDFYEKLSNKKDEAKKKNKVQLPKKKPEPPKPIEKEKKLVEKAKKPVPEKKDEIPTEAIPPEEANGEYKFTVQLASLEEEYKAQVMVDRLVEKGYAAYFYSVSVKGKTYYRVRCGRFKERSEAQVYAKELAKASGIKGFVSRLE